MRKIKEAYTYDDVQLVPKFSNIITRNDIDLRTLVSRRYALLVPLVASPMDTVCEEEMAYKIFTMGGVGCIHRFMTIDEQENQIRGLSNRIYEEKNKTWNYHEIPIMAAIGVQEEDRERAKQITKAGANILVIDVAHGHHINVANMIKWCKDNLYDHVDIIAGNIATAEAAIYLEEAGADGLRIGIGGGSLCSTRIRTGFGVPNVTALMEITEVAKTPVMADGGIRTSGDIAKALALGASTVMLGSLLAGTEESPGMIIETHNGLFKRYRGSASLETKIKHGKQHRNVEGESTVIPFKGGVKFVINGLLDGVKSALSYGGANNLKDYVPEIVLVTNSGLQEAKPHLLK